ncbi:MAG: AraC family transcriptional regulator [Eubacteriales bacterium]|nr:AraC family transcriptional regulator [Eubacteriales bacterium]
MFIPTADDESCIEETLQSLSQFNSMEKVFRDHYRLNHCLDTFTEEERSAIEKQYERFAEGVFHMSTSVPYAVLPDTKEPFFKNGPIHLMKHARYIPSHKHIHSFFEFFYVLKGKCTHVCGSKRYPLTAGDFCLWQFDIPHYIHSDSDDCLAINILIQKPAFQAYFFGVLSEQNLLNAYFNKILYGNGDSPMIVFHTGDDRKFLLLICSMYQEYEKKPLHWQTMLTSYLSFLFVYLLREHQGHLSSSEKTFEYDSSLEIFQYIQEHYDTVTLDDLCRKFNYTSAYLSRLIKKKSGMTFTQIVTRQRIEHGAWLLIHTDRTIGQIAREVHCSDTSHFCRLFLKFYGMSPGAYRNKNRE